ncbi:ABC transporter related [Ignisphaera aggregans DSM 17230]|uniref:ABC transporter related n=1 Tax=Ignisphaera aggregans (strain DSM 17230 / JCM 13409 / AQ1.S1) TaxID=583356 RepID=E0SRS4_IGNAA|nr:ABC transporter related [Ignisphaera aggregans DSM 17230]
MSIDIRNLSVDIGTKKILSNISISFGSGLHIVFGRNGAGKTTLFRAIAGLIKFSGDILVNGVSIRSLGRRELSKVIGYVWQNPYYGFIETSVKAEIEAILNILGVEGDWSIAEILVPRYLWDRDPSTLSGGEARRVSIASVLIADQPIWLLDEPFTNLDSDGVEALLRVIDMGRRKGKTIVIALHETFYAYLLKPDTVTILDGGRVVYRDVWSSIEDSILRRYGLIPIGDICAGYSHRRDTHV